MYCVTYVRPGAHIILDAGVTTVNKIGQTSTLTKLTVQWEEKDQK